MVHVDIAGPFDVSAAGSRYYNATVSDFTKVHCVVPVPTKCFRFPAIKDFVQRIQRQSGTPVKVIRSDGGLEFVSKDALDFYKSTGIFHQTSPRYTPELNGVVEKFNRTVKEMMSAMIDDRPLGHAFWDFAAKYAVTIINKNSTGGGGVRAWTAITGRSREH